MTDDFGIILNSEELYLDESLSTPGQIAYLGLVFCFQICGSLFPCPGWVDSAYPVITIWAGNILRNTQSKNAKFALYFFEGSYRIDVQKSGNAVTLRAVAGHVDNDVIEHEQTGEFATLFNTVYDTICKLLRLIYIDPRFAGRAEVIARDLTYYKDKMDIYRNYL